MTSKITPPRQKPGNVTGGDAQVTPSTAPSPPASEGQRLLLRVTDSLSTIGRAAGDVSKETVRRWKAGERVPQGPERRLLRAAYAIPVDAWERAPEAEPAAAEPPIASPDPSAPPASPSRPAHAPRGPAPETSSPAHFLELARQVRELRDHGGLDPAEELKAIAEERALLAQYQRQLAAVARDWDRRLRGDPQWQEFEDALMRALEKYPEAKAAVLDTLERKGP